MKLKIFITGIILALAITTGFGQGRVALKNAYLQSDLNANGQNITNLSASFSISRATVTNALTGTITNSTTGNAATATYATNFAGTEINVDTLNATNLIADNLYANLANSTNMNFANVSGTTSNALYTGAASALTGPANNEIPSAGWVRGLFQNGVTYYNSTNVATGFTNSDFPNIFVYSTNLPNSRARGYTNTALTAGNYVGTAVVTNRITTLTGPVVVDSYLGFTSSGSPSLTLHPEIYYSYDGTNWLGDWSAANETITLGQTNLYSWVVSVPTTISTNSTGFYVARRFKVGASSGLLASTTLWVTTGTNTVSGTSSGSHIMLPGSASAGGSATLVGNQTFTGSNVFSGGFYAAPKVAAFPSITNQLTLNNDLWTLTLTSHGSVTNVTGTGYATLSLTNSQASNCIVYLPTAWKAFGQATTNWAPSGAFTVPAGRMGRVFVDNRDGNVAYSVVLQQ